MPQHGFVLDIVVVVRFNNKLKRTPRHWVILLVEITFADQHVTVVDPAHVFFPVEDHRMLVNRFRCLLDGNVSVLRHFRCTGFIPVIENGKYQGIIILDLFLVLLNTLAQVVHPVPINIIMSGKIMVSPSKEGILLGRAGSQEHYSRKHKNPYGEGVLLRRSQNSV